MTLLMFSTVVAMVVLGVCLAQEKCVPADNCKAPDCRCWEDNLVPGGLEVGGTPQMVLVSFEYAINSANYELYTQLFSGLKNPNGCEPKGTFFVSKLNTDFKIVKQLHDAGHEIGMTTPDGFIPQDADQWLEGYKEMKAELVGAGIPEEQILGCRGPELYSGGNDQYDALKSVGLTYDSTCVSLQYTTKDNLRWPYTLDFVQGTPECTIGSAPSQAYPGKWQFLVADIEFKGQKCASPSSCSPLIETSQDAFDMLFEAFSAHYEGQRSPFILFIDPQWLMIDYQREATLQFLQLIEAAFDDTWIVTTQQALAWMKDPVDSTKVNDFGPWSCAK